MNVECTDAKGKTLFNIDVDGMPHLDASFEKDGKNYKITSVKAASNSTPENPIYECSVRKIGKDEV